MKREFPILNCAWLILPLYSTRISSFAPNARM